MCCPGCGSYDCVCEHNECEHYDPEYDDEPEKLCGCGYTYYGRICDMCRDDESDLETDTDFQYNVSEEDEDNNPSQSNIDPIGTYNVRKYFVDDETAEVS